MDKLIFKSFTWPTNPEVYHEECVRDAVYTKTDEGDSVFSGMGPLKRVITGSGTFFGSTANDDFKRLAALLTSAEKGALVHPVWGTRSVYFTKLQLTQNPRADFVAYSFEFTEADANGAIPK